MSDEPGVKITLSDIYKQGQETQQRVATLESTVATLARVDTRLDAHSKRLGSVEKGLVEQTRDAADIQGLKDQIEASEEEIKVLSTLVHRMYWVPVVGMALVTSIGGILITRMIG